MVIAVIWAVIVILYSPPSMLFWIGEHFGKVYQIDHLLVLFGVYIEL